MTDAGRPPPPPLVTRFAPSPTGLLHLGHAHSALDGWGRARAAGGRFVLRLEDIDPVRCRPAFAQAILQDLAWLGLDWTSPVRTQSEHYPAYRGVLDTLDARGLLYPCFCSRADIRASVAAPHQAPDGAVLYPGTCRHRAASERAIRLAAGEPHALRLDMARALHQAGRALDRIELAADGVAERVRCHPGRFGDVVLARRDVPASYHLCVTHDDALAGVTLVTRGVDLMPSTDLHRLLQALMGWPAPAYAHHRLLRDPDGRRLAKRDQALTLQALRDRGATPAEVRAMAGFP